VAELPQGTVTYLFTDIEGSTRLLTELGERYQEVQLDHQQILRGTFTEYGGREVDTQGDVRASWSSTTSHPRCGSSTSASID
jgi:class 3 adenylate cyclase